AVRPSQSPRVEQGRHSPHRLASMWCHPHVAPALGWNPVISNMSGEWPAGWGGPSISRCWLTGIGTPNKFALWGGARSQLLSPVATTISAGQGQQGESPTTWRHSGVVVGRLVAVEYISAGAP